MSNKGLNQRFTTIEVFPGEWETKYLSKRNRSLSVARVIALGKLITECQNGINPITQGDIIVLIDNEDGTYTVVDGQHRIAAASGYVGLPSVKFTACIRGKDFPLSLVEQVRQLNSGKPFDAGDTLEVLAPDTKWVQVFASFGLSPEFKSRCFTHESWLTVLTGWLVGKESLAAGRLKTNKPSREAREEFFMRATQKDIQDVAKMTKWWFDGVRAAGRPTETRALFTASAFTFAVSLWLCPKNRENPYLLLAAKNIAAWSNLRQETNGTTAGGLMRPLHGVLLKAANLNVPANRQLHLPYPV